MVGVVLIFSTIAAIAAVLLGRNHVGPRVPEERIAQADLELVREKDRTAWRKVTQSTYESWKKQDDFFRIAAYKKAVDSGMSESAAKAHVKHEFPFYYLDPECREEDTYVGDDAGLPIVLRERVNRGSMLLKTVMVEKSGQFRTMNALVREFIRKGVL